MQTALEHRPHHFGDGTGLKHQGQAGFLKARAGTIMRGDPMGKPTSIRTVMIAPCGMDCAICLGHLREKRQCPGCLLRNRAKSAYCRKCSIRFCRKPGRRQGKFCFGCQNYPCQRLKQLDKRYRTRYGMSMLENLAFIKTNGIRRFVRQEQSRWRCPSCGRLLCVHRPQCLSCGAARRMHVC